MTDITVFADHGAFVAGAVDFIAEAAASAVAQRGRFSLALCGGSTPRPVYAELASRPFDWSRTDIFFGDERCVPPDDDQSNYQMAARAWFEKAGVPDGVVRRIRGEDEPDIAALRYERELASTFRSRTPEIDLVLLGLGGNGHTASLFPGTAALQAQRFVVAQYVEVVGGWRVTMTAPAINQARQVAFLVAGAEKASILRNVLSGPYQPDVWPAQLIRPVGGGLRWLLDAAAASQ